MSTKAHLEVARQEQIVAIPTLMKMSPLPQKLMVGDFSDEAKVLKALGIEPLGLGVEPLGLK